MAVWNPLRKWFTDAPAQAAAPAVAPAVDRAPAVTQDQEALAAGVDVNALDRQFSAQMLAIGDLVDGPPTDVERLVLDRLAQLAAQRLDPALMPRLPAVVPKLMGLLRRDDSSPRELAALIARDPSLVGEVVRLANSARYRPPRPITELQGAVQALGLLGLAQLVTRVAMRPIFRLERGRFGQAAGGQLWELADRCAQACAWLRAGHVDAFAAYLSGTAAHVGLMAAVRVLDQTYPAGHPPPRSAGFHEDLWLQSARLSVLAARDWAFPDEVLHTLTLRAYGPGAQRAEPPAEPLSHALWAADLAAKRTMLGAASTLAPHGDVARAEAELARSFEPEVVR